MSRPSTVWIVFWVVCACLLIVVWQALQIPEEETAHSSQDGKVGVGGAIQPGGVMTDDLLGAREDLDPNGLLRTLPSPQNPPQDLTPKGRKQWHDQLIGLIDEASYLEDEASLRMLIVEFGSPDREIADAARTSLMARHDRKALPYLEEMKALKLTERKRQELQQLIVQLGRISVLERDGSSSQ